VSHGSITNVQFELLCKALNVNALGRGVKLIAV